MLKKPITRRAFLKAAGGVAASLAFGVPIPGHAREREWFENYDFGVEYPGICHMCFWGCGIKARVVNGVVEKIEGNPEHPFNLGRICARGNSGIMALYDPDRLKKPLVRVGERGENKFKAVSWDEALNLVAEKLERIKEKYGVKSIAFFSHGAGATFFRRLFRAYGVINRFAPSFSQ